MRRSDDDLITDGGTSPEGIPEDLFTRTSDISTLSTNERIVRWVDLYLRTPLTIAVSDIRTLVGGLILLIYLLMGTVGPVVIAPPSPFEGPVFLSPFQKLRLILGTGSLGQDLFAQVVHATPAMFKMIFAGALFSIFLGTLIGVTAGYKSGVIDRALMTFTDLFITIPGIVLVIVLASIYPPRDPFLVGLILGIDNWPGLARTVRSQVLSIREQAVVEASRSMGLSNSVIFRKDIITNIMPYVSINLARSARGIIFESVGLYFLGILPFTTLNWGVMMNEAYKSGNLTNPSRIHWLLIPMFTIMIFSFGLVMFAQGLDRVFNVRLKARHAKTVGEGEEEEGDVARIQGHT